MYESFQLPKKLQTAISFNPFVTTIRSAKTLSLNGTPVQIRKSKMQVQGKFPNFVVSDYGHLL